MTVRFSPQIYDLTCSPGMTGKFSLMTAVNYSQNSIFPRVWLPAPEHAPSAAASSQTPLRRKSFSSGESSFLPLAFRLEKSRPVQKVARQSAHIGSLANSPSGLYPLSNGVHKFQRFQLTRTDLKDSQRDRGHKFLHLLQSPFFKLPEGRTTPKLAFSFQFHSALPDKSIIVTFDN